jgi:MinD superfamily P-loop ATPase
MVHELVKCLGKPCAVVMNKVVEPENPAEEYCKQQDLEVLLRIPFDKTLARDLAAARVIVEADATQRSTFTTLLERVQEIFLSGSGRRCHSEAASHSQR